MIAARTGRAARRATHVPGAAPAEPRKARRAAVRPTCAAPTAPSASHAAPTVSQKVYSSIPPRPPPTATEVGEALAGEALRGEATASGLATASAARLARAAVCRTDPVETVRPHATLPELAHARVAGRMTFMWCLAPFAGQPAWCGGVRMVMGTAAHHPMAGHTSRPAGCDRPARAEPPAGALTRMGTAAPTAPRRGLPVPNDRPWPDAYGPPAKSNGPRWADRP